MTATYKFDYCIDRVAEGIDEHNPIYARLWLKRAKEAHDADIENDASAAIMLTEAIESNSDSHGGRTPETWIGDTIGQAVQYGQAELDVIEAYKAEQAVLPENQRLAAWNCLGLALLVKQAR